MCGAAVSKEVEQVVHLMKVQRFNPHLFHSESQSILGQDTDTELAPIL